MNSITFQDADRPAYTFKAFDNPLTPGDTDPAFLALTNGLTVQDSSSNVTFESSIHFYLWSGNHVLNVGSGATVTVAGNADELILDPDSPFSASVEKQGNGTLILSGSNSFDGGMSVTGGTLLVGNDNAVGTGILKLYNGTALGVTSGGSITLGNLISLDCNPCATVTIDLGCTDTLKLTGNISGAAGLKQTGGGTLALSGSNDFSGGVKVRSGTLLVGSDSALGTGTLSLDDGTTLGVISGSRYHAQQPDFARLQSLRGDHDRSGLQRRPCPDRCDLRRRRPGADWRHTGPVGRQSF
ncbi:MAG: autotransporter-associated beta strand repeat-containing protein [Lacunisphaera sp.]